MVFTESADLGRECRAGVFGVESELRFLCGEAGIRLAEDWLKAVGTGIVWWTTTGGASCAPLSSCSIDRAPSIHFKVAWEVAFSSSSWSLWQVAFIALVLSLPALASWSEGLAVGNASIVSAILWCFWSTLFRMSWTEPKASRTESDRVCSCSEGSPLEIWDLGLIRIKCYWKYK